MLAMSRKSAAGAAPGRSAPRLLLFNDLSASIACGAGFGAMHSVMAYGALLGTAVASDAAFYWDACPQLSAYVLSAATGGLASLLHVALHVLATDAWRTAAAARRGGGAHGGGSPSRGLAVALCAAPLALHLAFSEASQMSASGACTGAIPVLAALTAAAGALAAWRVRQPGYAAKRQMTIAAQLESAAGGGAGGHGHAAGWVAVPPSPASADADAATASGVARSATGPTMARRPAAG